MDRDICDDIMQHPWTGEPDLMMGLAAHDEIQRLRDENERLKARLSDKPLTDAEWSQIVLEAGP